MFQTVTIEKGPHALREEEDRVDGGGGSQPQVLLSSFKPPPRPQPLSQAEIDRDVQIVLQNLGLDNPNYD